MSHHKNSPLCVEIVEEGESAKAFETSIEYLDKSEYVLKRETFGFSRSSISLDSIVLVEGNISVSF